MAGAIVIALAAVRLSGSSEGEASPAIDAAALEAVLQPGDVVFIGADDALWGQIGALITGDRHVYAHVGMAAERGGALVIVHAAGSPTNAEAEVAAEPAARFAAQAQRAAVYRPQTPRAAAAASRALAYAEGGARFDGAFSLESEDRLYCTELVWRALTEAVGEDVAPQKSQFGDLAYIAIEDLRAAEILTPVARFGDAPPR